jgi:hypothetical protein
MADPDPLVEVVVHEDSCPQDGSCSCNLAGVTVGAEDPALAPGLLRCSACQRGEPFTEDLTQEAVAEWMDRHLETCPGWRDRTAGDQPGPGGPVTLTGDSISRPWRYR